MKKLNPVKHAAQDLSPPSSERNCHANQLRPFKMEEELAFPNASPHRDPDYVDPWQYVRPDMRLRTGMAKILFLFL